MTLRLSPRQKYFLWTLSDEPKAWSCCDPCERRCAEALAKRGLVEIEPDPPPRDSFFEARIMDKGLVRASIFAMLTTYSPPSHEDVYGKLRWRTH